jgi:hypothetical protein
MHWLRRLFRRHEPTPLELELADWRIVDALSPETRQAAVFRLRIRKPRLDNLDAFRFAVRIKWPYEGVMPTPEVGQQQTAFDIALDELTAENGYAELVRVATGNGLKEWLFYATDPQVFGENFNRVLDSHPKYPVSVEFEEDPAWHEWATFVESVAEKTKL